MILKPAHYVPPTKKVDEMFDYFQAHSTRVAIILGEYGEVSGIVTMKDVLKFIFGEINGKMVGQEYYKEDDENSYIVPGDMRLTDFYNLTNFDIEDTVMSTIGGVAFRLFDRLPEPGDQITHEGFRFIVKQRSGLRISQLQVQKLSSSDKDHVDTNDVTAVETTTAADAVIGSESKPSSNSDADDQPALPQEQKLTSSNQKKKKKKDDTVINSENESFSKANADDQKSLHEVTSDSVPDDEQKLGDK